MSLGNPVGAFHLKLRSGRAVSPPTYFAMEKAEDENRGIAPENMTLSARDAYYTASGGSRNGHHIDVNLMKEYLGLKSYSRSPSLPPASRMSQKASQQNDSETLVPETLQQPKSKKRKRRVESRRANPIVNSIEKDSNTSNSDVPVFLPRKKVKSKPHAEIALLPKIEPLKPEEQRSIPLRVEVKLRKEFRKAQQDKSDGRPWMGYSREFSPGIVPDLEEHFLTPARKK